MNRHTDRRSNAARAALWLTTVVLASSLLACRSTRKQPEPAAVRAQASGAPAPPEPADRYEIIEHLDRCEVIHDGPVIPTESRTTRAREGYSVPTAGSDSELVDREGGRFLRVFARRLSYDFWLAHAQTGVRVRARVHAEGATRISCYVDGHLVGTSRLEQDETQIVSVTASKMELVPGRHTLLLRFVRSRDLARDRPHAELEWVNVGEPTEEAAGTYDAPTPRKMVVDVEIEKQPRRSIVMRAPAMIRCPVFPAPDAVLRVSLGFWGAGTGTAAVRVRAADEPSATVLERRVRGGSDAQWVPLEVSLARQSSGLATLELEALQSSSLGRVVFGDPVLVRSKPRRLHVPPARVVVVVIAAGLDRRRIPPWAPPGKLVDLGELAQASTAFAGYRTPTSVPAGVAASLLTGMSPREHTFDDPSARLPSAVKLLSSLVKEGGGRTAMFTAVPSTFSAFGFNVGWDRFEQFSPVRDLPATEALERGAIWLRGQLRAEETAPSLLVVHTPGGHPPWDLTRDEARLLPPDDYAGTLDARRGGIELARLRALEGSRRRRLSEDDWIRLHALMDGALAKQSASIGHLVEVIERADAWKQTLLVFMGDVAVGDAPKVPFDPIGHLEEDRLLTPLIVRFPDGKFGGAIVSSQVTTADVTATVMKALGLTPPEWVDGDDLYVRAAGLRPLVGRAAVAALGDRYSTRLGNWLLRGRLGRKPSLCASDVDPACLADLFDRDWLAAPALWFQTVRALEPRGAAGSPPAREPASIDPDTLAALTVWGSVQ
ncbi:MAG: sulfatase-like hydrolase/transferase [Polyangiaceae bacterium]|nr:sulfatase-like hydrolase/transferase [Polyangiaceae bacterium]